MILDKTEFNHYETALIAFISDLEKKVHSLQKNIPVLFNNLDETYYLLRKYKHLPKEKVQELYNVIPRLVLKFSDIQVNKDSFTSNYNKQIIAINEKQFEVNFKAVPTDVTFDLTFVCSNFLKGLKYFELLNTIFCVDNTYSYNNDGNRYDGQYSLSSNLTLEPVDINGTTESKNCFIKGTLALQIKPSMYSLKTYENIFAYGNNSKDDLIDTGILIDNETGENINLWIDNDGNLVNSNLNSQQAYNDLTLSESDILEIYQASHVKLLSNKLIVLQPKNESIQYIKFKPLSDN